ncbi:signal peptidase I [Prochlorococcus sp. MIT 1307]|uniref:signal peptidase I n=1 Tax=Prochlorococcus sp. MIT 1307 TaxID=3096219 RepID=UPI002A756DD3|nr:signal peptidase I [Prochlorococcus sp. MIT 1307]
MNSSQKKQKSENKNGWFSFLIWLTLALLLRWQVIEPRWIPSGSMLPTLEVKDRILVEKVSPKINFLRKRQLSIESVVVFHPPKQLINAGYDKNSALIKRIVGLPGDKIEVHKGQLIRNDKEINESWRVLPINYEMDAVIIPNHSLWVLGDNRNNSLDSHLWGLLPEGNVIGTAIWRYWPINKFGPIRFPTPQKIRT